MRRFYDRLVLPRLVHFGMSSERLRHWRALTVAGARGRVLEVGIGSGLNFPFYSRNVVEVVGIDPSQPLLQRAARAAVWMPYRVCLIHQSAESLPFPDSSFDSVVASWTLSSIHDVEACLYEVARVLKRGGRLHFIEHGEAAAPHICRWQQRLSPAWELLAGGCHLDRRPDWLIEKSGLTLQSLDVGDLFNGPRLLTYNYRGIAAR